MPKKTKLNFFKVNKALLPMLIGYLAAYIYLMVTNNNGYFTERGVYIIGGILIIAITINTLMAYFRIDMKTKTEQLKD